jgi:hypothetical protein
MPSHHTPHHNFHHFINASVENVARSYLTVPVKGFEGTVSEKSLSMIRSRHAVMLIRSGLSRSQDKVGDLD